MSKTYVIVGSSASAMGVLTVLRKLDSNSRIVCISKSQYTPYNTCLLPDYIAGEKTRSELFIKSAEFFAKGKIEFLLNTKVETIDSEKKIVFLSDTQSLSYDKLFLGIGTAANLPDIKGINQFSEISKIQTLEDADFIVNFINKNVVKTVTIIGAGPIGLETSWALSSRGIKVNLVDHHLQVLSRYVDVDGAKIIENSFINHNVSFYKNSLLKEVFGEDQKVNSVKILVDGKKEVELETGLLILAFGGKTDLKLAESIGIDCKEGSILVDEFMQTSVADIYAGGDACLVQDILTEKKVKSCTWADAINQGICVACNMAGIEKKYEGVLIVLTTSFYDISIASCGSVLNPPSDYKIDVLNKDNSYQEFLTKDGILKGFLIVGKLPNIGLLRRIILTKSKFDLNEL